VANVAIMAVTLTDEQAKNSASSLRAGAASQLATADLLDPPVAPLPVPPAGGGSTPAPSGFTGRTLGDPAVWKQQASFEENFPTLAPQGQFLNIYKMWGAYPTNYLTTDKQGSYDPGNIAVVDVDGVRAMELRVVSGKTNGKGKPSGATPEARLLGPKNDVYTTGERIQSRMKLYKPGPAATSFISAGPCRTPIGRRTASPITSRLTPVVHPPWSAGSTSETAEARGRDKSVFSPTSACSTGSSSLQGAYPARATAGSEWQALQAGAGSGRRTERGREGGHYRSELAVQHPVVRAPVGDPVRVKGHEPDG
jgi:hypothetical protein